MDYSIKSKKHIFIIGFPVIGVAFCNALEPKNIVNKVVKQFRKEPSEVSEESFDFDNVTRDITTTFDAYCPGGSEMFEVK